VLTDVGRVVYRYADEIFALGKELQNAVKGLPVGRPRTLVVGIADVVPKMVAEHILEPAFHLAEPVQLVCREDKPDRLLADLAAGELDVVILDSPVGPSLRVKVWNHLLGECGAVLFADDKLAKKYRKGFPRSLDGAPLLLPTENTALRRALDHWFSAQQIRPRIVGEFEDSALLKVFGQRGMGIFPASDVIAAEVERQYQVRRVGKLPEVRDRFYAISVERKLKHPAVLAITEAARHQLFR
jgi:LysR family transcriptional activator of nhaA